MVNECNNQEEFFWRGRFNLNFGRLNIFEIVGYLAFFHRKEIANTCGQNHKRAKESLMELGGKERH